MARLTLFFAECINEYQQRGFWSDNLPVNFWERNDRAFHDKEAIVDCRVRLTCEQAKR